MRSSNIVLALLILLAGAGNVVANEHALSLERLTAMEAELAQMRAWQQQQSVAAGACCQSCGPQGFYGGAEALFLRPFFEEQAIVVTTDPAGVERAQDFQYDYNLLPRGWLGYVDRSGWGVRGSYWSMDEETLAFDTLPAGGQGTVRVVDGGTEHSTTVVAGGPLPMSFSHRLQLDVADGVVTRLVRRNGMRWEASAGARYAKMAQFFAGDVFRPLRLTHRFEGIGPVAGLGVSGDLGLGITADCQVGGAVLFGNESATIQQFGGGLFVDYERSSDNGVLSIGEIRLGLKKVWDTQCGEVFLRSGWEGQIWWGAGNATNTTADMGLQGFSIAAGVRR